MRSMMRLVPERRARLAMAQVEQVNPCLAVAFCTFVAPVLPAAAVIGGRTRDVGR